MSFNTGPLINATLVSLAAAMLLSGCWTPPDADVRPPGPTRVIQKGIVVRTTLAHAVVQSVDPQTRTLFMQVAGTPGVRAYRVGRTVPDLDRVHAGATVRATVAEELTVYVSPDGSLPGSDGGAGARPTARILSLDPSYRVLTLKSPDGQIQTFKVGLEVRLAEMHAGDQVLIQAPEIESLAVR